MVYGIAKFWSTLALKRYGKYPHSYILRGADVMIRIQLLHIFIHSTAVKVPTASCSPASAHESRSIALNCFLVPFGEGKFQYILRVLQSTLCRIQNMFWNQIYSSLTLAIIIFISANCKTVIFLLVVTLMLSTVRLPSRLSAYDIDAN